MGKATGGRGDAGCRRAVAREVVVLSNGRPSSGVGRSGVEHGATGCTEMKMRHGDIMSSLSMLRCGVRL